MVTVPVGCDPEPWPLSVSSETLPDKEKDMTTDQSTATSPLPTTSLRKTALIAGLLYLLTFISIPTLALYGSVHDPNYIIGPGTNNPVLVGGVLEVIVALAGIGTAVVLYPVLKRQNEPAALGLVGSRVLEALASSPASRVS
jgi:hypothetical protein